MAQEPSWSLVVEAPVPKGNVTCSPSPSERRTPSVQTSDELVKCTSRSGAPPRTCACARMRRERYHLASPRQDPGCATLVAWYEGLVELVAWDGVGIAEHAAGLVVVLRQHIPSSFQCLRSRDRAAHAC